MRGSSLLSLQLVALLIQTSGKGSPGGRGTYYYSRSADGQWEHNQILRNHYLLDISADDAIAFGPGGSTVYFFNKTEEPPIAVTGFSLVNADNNKVLRIIEAGDVIDLNDYEHENFNIVAHTEPENIGSVIMELEGMGEVPGLGGYAEEKLLLRKTEKKVPYALFGDKDGDFRNWQPEGANMSYTLTAAPYFESNQQSGVGGKPLTVEFELIDKGL